MERVGRHARGPPNYYFSYCSLAKKLLVAVTKVRRKQLQKGRFIFDPVSGGDQAIVVEEGQRVEVTTVAYLSVPSFCILWQVLVEL